MCSGHIVNDKGVGKRLLLFLCNIEFYVISYRGKTKKKEYHKAKRIVCKGSDEMIKNSASVKRRCAASLFIGLTTAKEKTYKYDLDKIEIKKIYYVKHIGYGIE